MGILWCKETQQPKTPTSPFRISNFGEEELVVHKLNYLKTVLNEQKTKYTENEAKETALAKQLKSTNVSEAKNHVMKAKLCRTLRNRLSDRIFLVQKQIDNIKSVKEDLEFATTLESSNRLLMKLTKEVDSKQLSEAIELIENADSHSKELQDLFYKYNANNEGDLNRDFEALGNPHLEPSQRGSGVPVQTIEELERKELAFN